MPCSASTSSACLGFWIASCWCGEDWPRSSCCLPFSSSCAAARAQSRAFVVEPASRVDLTVIITATGSVQPTNQVDVSSELSGTVRSVLVDYNSPVKVGQVLAELDTDKLKATLNSSRARLASVKAKVLDAEATLLEKKLVYERKKHPRHQQGLISAGSRHGQGGL